jgi:hypothetical protein
MTTTALHQLTKDSVIRLAASVAELMNAPAAKGQQTKCSHLIAIK